MAWYWIVLIVLAALSVLVFAVYYFNLDMKLVEKIYGLMQKHYDGMKRDRRL
ncbi:MAG: hypothetical protein RSB78_02975 [Oscillospiraceae bacterium]